MRYNAETLPDVPPMFVRKISPLNTMDLFGGVIVMDEYDVEDIGLVDTRMDYDEDVVDCSHRIFEITTAMMGATYRKNFTAFPSRRWRNHRVGMDMTGFPTKDEPLLYLGNPVRLFADPVHGITVVRIPEFLIKSGLELGF